MRYVTAPPTPVQRVDLSELHTTSGAALGISEDPLEFTIEDGKVVEIYQNAGG